MDRSLMRKASALARGTRKIDLSILSDDPESEILEAEFVDLPTAIAGPIVEQTSLAVIVPARVTPGRARRATDAYTPAREVSKVIAIG
jgi:hypothetical protein